MNTKTRQEMGVEGGKGVVVIITVSEICILDWNYIQLSIQMVALKFVYWNYIQLVSKSICRDLQLLLSYTFEQEMEHTFCG